MFSLLCHLIILCCIICNHWNWNRRHNAIQLLKPYCSIVLVDLNEFPSIFHKVQHSNSRPQKTTSNLLRINLEGILKFNEMWPLEGAMYITLWQNFWGIPKMLVLCNFLRKLMVSDKKIHRAFQIHTTL